MYFHAVSVLFYFISAGAAPYTEAQQAILLDVQDGVGSIEQAGWYVLLERIGKDNISSYDKEIWTTHSHYSAFIFFILTAKGKPESRYYFICQR